MPPHYEQTPTQRNKRLIYKWLLTRPNPSVSATAQLFAGRCDAAATILSSYRRCLFRATCVVLRLRVSGQLLQIRQQSAGEFFQVQHLYALEPLRGEDRAHPHEALVQIAVDKNIVVFAPVRDFLDSIVQALRDDVATVFR